MSVFLDCRCKWVISVEMRLVCLCCFRRSHVKVTVSDVFGLRAGQRESGHQTQNWNTVRIKSVSYVRDDCHITSMWSVRVKIICYLGVPSYKNGYACRPIQNLLHSHYIIIISDYNEFCSLDGHERDTPDFCRFNVFNKPAVFCVCQYIWTYERYMRNTHPRTHTHVLRANTWLNVSNHHSMCVACRSEISPGERSLL